MVPSSFPAAPSDALDDSLNRPTALREPPPPAGDPGDRPAAGDDEPEFAEPDFAGPDFAEPDFDEPDFDDADEPDDFDGSEPADFDFELDDEPDPEPGDFWGDPDDDDE